MTTCASRRRSEARATCVTELTVATRLNRERVTVCPHCESLTVGVWGGHWSIALVETHSNKRSRS
jgi:hypothetical protein